MLKVLGKFQEYQRQNSVLVINSSRVQFSSGLQSRKANQAADSFTRLPADEETLKPAAQI